MTWTDWKYAGTIANVDRDGKNAWSNPSNAGADDGSYATQSPEGYTDYTDWLRCTNFGFDTDDVPSEATIDGVEVAIERKCSIATTLQYATDAALYLRDGDGQAGDDKADTSTKWPTSDTEVVYGASDDNWNAGLSDSDVRSSDFGVELSAYLKFALGRTASVDYIKVRINYTDGGGPTHTLTASDLTSGTPALSTPTIGQEHALSADNLTSGTPALETPTVGQTHALATSDLVSAVPAVEDPALEQEHALAADGITSSAPVLDAPTAGETMKAEDLDSAAPVLSAPSLGQEHGLGADDLDSVAPVLADSAVGQIHALGADDIVSAAPILGEPSVGLSHVLDADGISTTPVVSEPAIGQAHALTADNISTTPVLSEPTAGQTHALSADVITGGAPVLGTPTVAEIHTLSAEGISVTPVLGAPWLHFAAETLKVLVYDSTGTHVARIKNWEKLYYTRVDSGPGYVEIIVPNDSAAQYLQSGNEIVIERKGDDVFTGELIWGIQEWEAEGEQTEKIAVRGESAEAICGQRQIVRPADADSQAHTGYVDNAMKDFVRNCFVSGTASASRAITGFSVAANASEHPDSKTLSGGYKDNLLDKLNKWHDAYDVDWWVERDVEADTWTFQTGYPRRGTDKSSSVVFNVKRHNVRGLKYTKDSKNKETLIYVGGPGEGVTQTVNAVYNGAEPTGKDRYESFVGAPDAEYEDELDMVGAARLSVFGEDVENVTFEYQETEGTEWPDDFDAGDLVTVYDPIYDVTVEAKIEYIAVEVLQAEPDLIENITIRVGPDQADMWELYENKMGPFSKFDDDSAPAAPTNVGYNL